MYGAMASLDGSRVLAGQVIGKISRADLNRSGLVPRLDERHEASALLRALGAEQHLAARRREGVTQRG